MSAFINSSKIPLGIKLYKSLFTGNSNKLRVLFLLLSAFLLEGNHRYSPGSLCFYKALILAVKRFYESCTYIFQSVMVSLYQIPSKCGRWLWEIAHFHFPELLAWSWPIFYVIMNMTFIDYERKNLGFVFNLWNSYRSINYI